MQPPRHHSYINLAEMKARIVKKLGPDGSNQYFYYLNRFLSLKLSRAEFNNLCLKILGRENIPLHNHLIRSILKNASSSDKRRPYGPHTSTPHPCSSPGLANGGGRTLLPISPKRARTGSRGGDRRSTLGLNGKIAEKTSFTSHSPRVSKNGFLQNFDNERDKISRCSEFSVPSCSEHEPWSPIKAPLGAPFCPRRAPAGGCGPLFHSGVLSDSVSLRSCMEQIALAEGLQGVSLDSANLLSHGLDSYMKLLIRSCIEHVGFRQGRRDIIKSSSMNNMIQSGYQNLVQNDGIYTEVEEQINYCSISFQDFRIAMEMNRWKLGEDLPLLLEKICTDAFHDRTRVAFLEHIGG